MMKMAFIRGKDRDACLFPSGNCHKGIHNRHGKSDQGDDEDDDGRRFHRSHDRDGADDVAQEHRSRIAHENFRRIEIILQKRKARARHSDHRRRADPLTHLERQKRNRDRGNRRNSRCQTVQAIDEIYRIYKSDNPKNRKRHGNRRGKIEIPHKGELQPIDADAETDDENRRRDDLPHKLYARRKRIPVIQNPDNHQKRRAHTKPRHPRIIKPDRQRDRDNKPGKNRKPPETRHEPVMNLTRIRPIHRPDPDRQFLHKRRQQQRDQKCGNKCIGICKQNQWPPRK